MSSDIEREPWRTAEYGNLALVRAVKKRPCLYNTTMPEYSQKDITRAAWEEIAEEFGCPVDFCKNRWMRLRENFGRDLIQVRSRNKPPSKFTKHMSFILPFRKKEQQVNISRSLQDNINAALEESIHKSMNLNKTKDCVDSMLLDPNEFEREVVKLKNSNMTEQNSASTFAEIGPESIEEIMPGSTVQVISNNPENYASNLFLAHNKLEKESAEVKPNTVMMEEFISTFSDFADYNSFKNSTRTQYVLSLQPEIDELTETQFRSFKRKILSLIDDVKHV